MVKKLITCLLLTGIACSSALAQQGGLDTLQQKFKAYREGMLQEKIYVHVDRPNYLTGETMWFRIYYTNATTHRALDVSKVCYIELLDADNKSVAQTKVEMAKGGGSGSLFLPASLLSGTYAIRAYTAWMKNFSPEFYFHSAVAIINPFRTPEPVTPPAATVKKPDAQFFPEGGHLLAGVKSKVGFRVTDEYGKGISFDGAVLNEKNEVVVTFSPLKFGIGHFYFSPEEDHTYHADVTLPGGRIFTYALPEVKAEGYSLAVAPNGQVEITQRGDDYYAYLFVHTREMIQKANMIRLKSGRGSALIDKNLLAEGVTHITLFDMSMKPVCERLIFKKPSHTFNLQAGTDQSEYDVRRKGNLEVTGTAGAHVSVAVYKADSLPSPSQQNIESYFWLNSDLRGTIESPDYYLNAEDSTADLARDNLMLTHGWRRFNWDEVLNTQPVISFVPESRGHIVYGDISDQDGKPAGGVQAYVASPGKLVRLAGAMSNQRGEVFFEMPDFYGRRSLFVQTNYRDSMMTVKVRSPFSTQHTLRPTESFSLQPSMKSALLERSVTMQVQDVYAEDKNDKILNAVKDSTAFFGKADETYFLDDYTRFPVMEEVMREYVPGVLVRKRKDGFHFIVLDDLQKTVFRDDPMILMDGVPVFDADEIIAFDPLKVKKLEVVTRLYHLGTLTFPGIVSYSTYKGDLAGFAIRRNAVKLDYEGLQLRRQYYAPRYEDKASRTSRLPDQRTLISWTPDHVISANKKESIPFFTSDVQGKFIMVVQGLSDDGQPASSSATFEVTRFDN